MNIKTILGSVWALLIASFVALALIGVITEHVLYIKLSMVLGGFIFYSILMLSINKDDYDDSGNPFPLIEYAEKNWDNWVLNFIGAILLLVGGQQIFGIINLTEEVNLTWVDGYYVGSGFIVNFIVDRLKAKRKKA